MLPIDNIFGLNQFKIEYCHQETILLLSLGGNQNALFWKVHILPFLQDLFSADSEGDRLVLWFTLSVICEQTSSQWLCSSLRSSHWKCILCMIFSYRAIISSSHGKLSSVEIAEIFVEYL